MRIEFVFDFEKERYIGLIFDNIDEVIENGVCDVIYDFPFEKTEENLIGFLAMYGIVAFTLQELQEALQEGRYKAKYLIHSRVDIVKRFKEIGMYSFLPNEIAVFKFEPEKKEDTKQNEKEKPLKQGQLL